LSDNKIVFENRFEAGSKLAQKLLAYKDKQVVVLAIPNGGVPVALQVALALNAEMDIVVSRKLPVPLRPEGGFGAVTDDGTVMLNDKIVEAFQITEKHVHYQIQKVRNSIRNRSLFYKGTRPIIPLRDKTVIIVDDGLASGYTMLAAVESVRKRMPEEVIVAVPAASAEAVRLVDKVADKIVTCYTATSGKFYVQDSYRYWHVLKDEEGLKCLKEWQHRRFHSKLDK